MTWLCTIETCISIFLFIYLFIIKIVCEVHERQRRQTNENKNTKYMLMSFCLSLLCILCRFPVCFIFYWYGSLWSETNRLIDWLIDWLKIKSRSTRSNCYCSNSSGGGGGSSSGRCGGGGNHDVFYIGWTAVKFMLHLCVFQEPVPSSGYICQFKDLQVRCVLLDEIMPKPDLPELECIVVTEAKVSKLSRHCLQTNCSNINWSVLWRFLWCLFSFSGQQLQLVSLMDPL